MPQAVITKAYKEKKGHLVGWYPRSRKSLEAKLNVLEDEALEHYQANVKGVRACIVPHAGLHYSGAQAISCFRLVDAKKIKRIVLLAPSHHLPFAGIALPKYVSYKIANGSVPIDTKVVDKLQSFVPFQAQKRLLKDPHDLEHSIEIELPLIARYFPKIPLVPLLVGYLDKKGQEAVINVLKEYIDENTLVIASSDFTHYGPRFDYQPFDEKNRQKDRIRELDSNLMQPVFKINSQEFLTRLKEQDATVCGKYPIALLLALLEKSVLKNLEPYLVSYGTSQDKDSKDPAHSVSYAGIVFGAPHIGDLPLLSKYEKNELLRLARTSITNTFAREKELQLSYPILSNMLQKLYGVFVTIYDKDHALRGCIGSFSPEPLHQSVEKRAIAAAFQDSRFTSLRKKEVDDVTFSISVLGKSRPIKNYKDIKLGQHGIILRNGKRQAVFLPKVPIDQGWTLAQTLEQLSVKAGLSKQAWKNKKTKYQIFDTLDFGE